MLIVKVKLDDMCEIPVKTVEPQRNVSNGTIHESNAVSQGYINWDVEVTLSKVRKCGAL